MVLEAPKLKRHAMVVPSYKNAVEIDPISLEEFYKESLSHPENKGVFMISMAEGMLVSCHYDKGILQSIIQEDNSKSGLDFYPLLKGKSFELLGTPEKLNAYSHRQVIVQMCIYTDHESYQNKNSLLSKHKLKNYTSVQEYVQAVLQQPDLEKIKAAKLVSHAYNVVSLDNESLNGCHWSDLTALITAQVKMPYVFELYYENSRFNLDDMAFCYNKTKKANRVKQLMLASILARVNYNSSNFMNIAL